MDETLTLSKERGNVLGAGTSICFLTGKLRNKSSSGEQNRNAWQEAKKQWRKFCPGL